MAYYRRVWLEAKDLKYSMAIVDELYNTYVVILDDPSALCISNSIFFNDRGLWVVGLLGCWVGFGRLKSGRSSSAAGRPANNKNVIAFVKSLNLF